MFQNKSIKISPSLTLSISYLKCELCWTYMGTMEIIETVYEYRVITLDTEHYQLFLNA